MKTEQQEKIMITKFKDTGTPDFELNSYQIITKTEAVQKIEKAIFSLANNISNLKTKDYNTTKCTAHWIAQAAIHALIKN